MLYSRNHSKIPLTKLKSTVTMVKEVTSKWLAERIATRSGDVLLLDTRSAEEYHSGYINGSVHICCSGMILRRLRNGSLKMESLLNCPEDKQKYGMAKESEQISVVVCDHNTEHTSQLVPESIAYMVLKKISKDCKFVSFLSGGFDEFQVQYGELCELPNSAAESLLKKRPSSLVLQLNGLALNSKQAAVSEGDSPTASEHIPPFEILPHLYLGCRKVAACLPSLRENQITRILNVTSSVPNQFEDIDGFVYKQIAVEDSHEVDMIKHLPEAFCFIEEAKNRGEKVLVHCHAGMSRSVTVIIAYLMKFYHYSLDNAFDFVKSRKQNISPNFSFMGQLIEYESYLKPSVASTSPAESGYGSSRGSPVDGHCFLPSPVGFSRPCVLAA